MNKNKKITGNHSDNWSTPLFIFKL